jgi:hypothetical protein
VKDLLLTLRDPSISNQAIAQVIQCDNRLFEHQQERHHEPTLTTQRMSTPLTTKKKFAPPTTQRSFPPTTLTRPSTTSPKDDLVHIDKTRFKPLTKQDKQH